MKKFLSLVLALVMTMSLVTISAGAKDFTDDDAIKYEEAIDVMSAVKVIDGYTDGSFKPATQLNRGQAAKIICNMVLGPTTASALKADAAPFKDVAADNTFAGYIAYCVQAGLIDGYTDGTYKPTAPLTGYAFMKYLLGCLGYDKDVEGYNGNNWSINVAKQALAIGLDNGLTDEFDGTKIVTREEACLFAFNAMKATMVQYSDKTEINAGGVTVTTTGNRYELDDTALNDTLQMDKLQFAEKYFKNLHRTSTQDAYGRPATEWKVKADKVGTYVDYSQKIAEYTSTVKAEKLYDLVGSSVVKHLVNVPADLHVYMNGVYTTTTGAGAATAPAKNVTGQLEAVKLHNAASTIFEKNSSNKIGGAGVKTEIFMDDSGVNPVVTIVSVGTYLYKASEDYNSKKETVRVAAIGDTQKFLPANCSQFTLSADDFDIADVKADDYLLLTVAFDGAVRPTVKSVTPAEVVKGTVTTYSYASSKVTMDGTERSYAFATVKEDAATPIPARDGVAGTTFTVGQEASVILDTYGNIIGIDKAVVNTNYLFVNKAATVSALGTSAVAAAYFTDGTTDEIDLKEVCGNKTAATIGTDAFTHGWYTFSKNGKDEYTLYPVEGKYTDVNTELTFTGTDVVVDNSTVDFTDDKAAILADNSTVFVVLEADDTLTSYTGIKNVPDISITGGTAKMTYVAKSATGYAGYVFIDLKAATGVSIENASSSDLLYVLKYDRQTWINDMNTYYTFKALDENLNEVEINTSSSTTFGTNYDLYRNPKTNSDGYVSGTATWGSDTKYISGPVSGANCITYSNGTLTFSDGNTYVLAADAKIVLVGLKGSNLNRDPGADYEADYVSGQALAAAMASVNVTTGSYKAVKTSGTSNVITTLYVTINAASRV